MKKMKEIFQCLPDGGRHCEVSEKSSNDEVSSSKLHVD